MPTEMVERFQKSRWSRTRNRMHAMKPGQVLKLPRSEYFNAYTSKYRLNDAYGGKRVWTLRKSGKEMVVTHEKQTKSL